MPAKFTCQFTMTNPDEGSYDLQAADTIRGIQRLLGAGHTGGTILDVNGNKIGSWKLR